MPAQLALSSSAVASPASPSRKRGSARRRRTRAGSGLTSLQSSLSFIHASCSSRTSPGCGRPVCVTCYVTFPSSGSMRAGILSARPRSVRRTSADASSFLPTLTARDWKSGASNLHGKNSRPLSEVVRLFFRRGPVAYPDRQRQLQPQGLESAQWRRPGRRHLQGDPWAVEPDVVRVVHGVPARVDRIRLLGNSCVPQQAAHAFATLLGRLL